MAERQALQLQDRARIIADYPIGNRLAALRASFAANSGQHVQARSDQSLLARQDLQHLTLELLVTLSNLPVARHLSSRDGQATLANDLLSLIAGVSSDISVVGSVVPLLSTALDASCKDEELWDKFYTIPAAPQGSKPSVSQTTTSVSTGRPQISDPSTRSIRPLRPSHVSSHETTPLMSSRGGKRYKVDIACDACRLRKVKCDGIRPACGACRKSKRVRATCQYSRGDEESNLRERNDDLANDSFQLDHLSEDKFSDPRHQGLAPLALPHIERQPFMDVSSGTEACAAQDNIGIVEIYQEQLHEYGISSMKVFFDRLRASIDAQLGIPADGNPFKVPLTDAPMFLAPSSNPRPTTQNENDLVLPSRKNADLLVDIYWSCVHPIEPVLDRKQFDSLYNALYAGTIGDGAEYLFGCTFNAVLALATQCQENIDLEQRQQTSKTYFDRAWVIIRPGQELWESPSLELVECLLLICSYLRCTTNAHQAWMAMGAAIRVAQSLGLHLLGNSSNNEALNARRIQLWRICIFNDKQMSLAQGRPRTINDCFVNAILEHTDISQEDEAVSTFITKSIELYQSVTSIKSSMPKAYQGRPARGIEQLAQKDDEYLHMVLRLEDRLVEWEQNLPLILRYTSGLTNQTSKNSALTATFKLRIAHNRIFIFRPMLAYLCLSKSHHDQHSLSTETLRQQIIRNCASVCIKNAQEIISILQEQCHPEILNNAPIPWWHRMLYLHVAVTTLIAATLSGDTTAEFQTSASLDQLVSLLHAHEHCANYISQYSQAFGTLLAKVSSIRFEPPGEVPATSESLPPTPYLQELFPGSTTFPFGLEDILYLDNL
ncbi:unnamed protein product [Clonostachys byssicola]|uniref:Zn(2)-C6 fungal-type domain-containing protein n=1 Tax=Clonostachys byssicola TaxID=160290 RepID=A0A9N9UNZ7_9HYPO|nr:unnamed protein product [Clonostachys byssicola]